MYKSKLKNLSFLLGIIIMVVGFGAVILWESYGKEALLYKEIIVAKVDINRGDIVSDDMLGYLKIEHDKIINGAVYDSSAIIGLEAKQYIPANAQLSNKYFDVAGATLSEGEYIFKVPNDWLIAFPSTIRRKDTAVFYAVNYQALYNVSNVKNNVDDISSFDYSDKKALDFLKSNSKIVAEVRVAYVKDSANREVTTISEEDRFDGSSQVSSIEIIVNSEILSELYNAINDGYKFIVLYNDFN